MDRLRLAAGPMVVVALVASLAAGCGGKSSDQSANGTGNTPPPPPPSCPSGNYPVVDVTGSINAPVTWESGKVYAVSPGSHYVSAPITVQKCAVVKFKNNNGGSFAFLSMQAGGSVVTQGTIDQPSTFTSWLDDAHGGDSNADGNTTSPARGDWDGVFVNGVAGSSFVGAQFLYGGRYSASSVGAVLGLGASVATVTDSVFAHNLGGDPTNPVGALDAHAASVGSVIARNVFFDNSVPMSFIANFDLDETNLFHDPANPSVKNKYNGVFASGYDTIMSGTLHWTNTEVPYVLSGTTRVMNGLTLRVGPGVVLKMQSGAAITVYGVLLAQGTAGAPVVFTSLKDDAWGGDTNGDGSATSPAVRDWDGVDLAAGAGNGEGSVFDHCRFSYSGSYWKRALSLGAHQATVTNSVFAHNNGGTPADTYNLQGTLNAQSAKVGTVISGNVFFDNLIPMSFNGNYDLDASNVFHDPENPASTNRYQGMFGGFDATTVTTLRWSNTEVAYALSAGTVSAGTTFQLSPGVVVKHWNIGSVIPATSVSGVILAQGTAVAPVTFTSFHDDSVGGDTDGDGGATPPAVRDWDGIDLYNDGSVLDHCRISYSGSYWRRALALHAYRATVTNSVFAHNNGGTPADGANLEGTLNAQSAKVGTVIRGNVFFDNLVPMTINVNYDLDDTNLFHDPSNPTSTNTYNAAWLGFNSASHGIADGASVTWSLANAPIALARVTIGQTTGTTAKLTVAPGTTLKFTAGGFVDNPNGGTFSYSGATLTSIKDDAHGGDTNGDGSATSPAPGDWAGIYIGGPAPGYAAHDATATVLYATH